MNILMNADAKILNRILANQIQSYVKRTIYHDCVGFIQGTQEWFNVCKSISETYKSSKRKNKNNVIISTDEKNAFDKI